MRTPEEYKESLRSMRPNVYKFGNLIEDVTAHPATRRMVEGHSKIYEIAEKSEYRDLVTTTSTFDSEIINRYTSLMTRPEDVIANSRVKRLMFNLTGTCTGGRCVGWNAMNAVYAVTWEIDAELDTDYHSRIKDWIVGAQRNDYAISGAMTDPKGNRRLPPSKQKDPDVHLRVVERRNDGVVVRGAKVMIAGVSASNHIMVVPGGAYREGDEDYAIAFTTPRDAEGITIVEARHPSDTREMEEADEVPVSRGGITQGYILFDDVFVPNERIFLDGEVDHTGKIIFSFIGPYRSAIGGCVAGQGDLMIGASVLMARANGLSEKAIRDKIITMAVNNETTYGVGIAAAVLGRQHPSGVWQPDQLLANVNKVHVATLPYDTKRMTQEVAGGIGETGCMPSRADMMDPVYGPLLRKYLTAEAPGEERHRIARFIEWLTIGAGVPGTMHGGGSSDGAKMLISRWIDLERDVKLVRELLDLDDAEE